MPFAPHRRPLSQQVRFLISTVDYVPAGPATRSRLTHRDVPHHTTTTYPRYFGGLDVVEWKHLGTLESLDLSNNELTNAMSPLAACTELRELKVASNKLTESISAEFAHCTRIHTFDVSNNELFGAIPTLHITRMPRLVLLYLHGNRLLVGEYTAAPSCCFLLLLVSPARV